MEHQIILDKIEKIKIFFESIGLKMIYDFPKDWNLDSYIKFEPIKNNYIINYKGEDRVLLSVNIYIASGLHFVLSGKIGVSVYETIPSDYDFKCKYEDSDFFKSELRDFKINNLLKYENI
jgi:hypothetical protein